MAELKDTNINGTLSISATSSGDDVADVYAELKAIKQAHQDLLDAFEYSRNLRNKYLTSTLIWDLGMTENFLQWLKGEAFACMND